MLKEGTVNQMTWVDGDGFLIIPVVLFQVLGIPLKQIKDEEASVLVLEAELVLPLLCVLRAEEVDCPGINGIVTMPGSRQILRIRILHRDDLFVLLRMVHR